MTGRLPVAYDNSANFVSTVAEYLAAIGSQLSFAVRYVHVTNGAELAAALCAGRIDVPTEAPMAISPLT